MKKYSFTLSLLIILALVASVVAQPARRGQAGTTTTAEDTAATATTDDVQKSLEEILEEPTTTDTYRYDPQGRRDPFRSLIGPSPKLEPGARPPGVPGFLIDELKLSGIFKTREGL